MAWTKEQQGAIDERNKNILVAAAAGSGKTAVLVERIIQRILAREISVDEILVVTFTHAAAAEMRQRIENALRKALKEQPESIYLERQLILLSNAAICTLHSFCNRLVRRNFQAVDIAPQFRLAGEEETALLKQDVIEDVFAGKYEAQEENFLRFTEAYGNEHGDETLHNIILQINAYAQSQAFPAAWLRSLQNDFQEQAVLTSKWGKIVKQELQDKLAGIIADNQNLAERAVLLGFDFYKELLEADQKLYQKGLTLLQEGSWDELYEFAGRINFARLSVPKDCKEQFEAVKKEFGKLRDNHQKKPFKDNLQKVFYAPEKEVREDLAARQFFVDEMVNLTLDFQQAFQGMKKEKMLVDFNDLEHFALQILLAEGSSMEDIRPSEIAKTLQKKYKEIMVDEYQDTNGVQEQLIQLLSSGQGNLFFVGDVKQSIYRFRLADPGIFLAKYQQYPQDKGCRRIDLAANFRSRASILAAINYIFAQVMVAETMELAYDEAAALHPGTDYPRTEGQMFNDRVEIDILAAEENVAEDTAKEAAESENLQVEEEERKGFAAEAKFIAQKVRDLMLQGTEIFDKGLKKYRPLAWRDIVVLLRSTSGKADVLLEEFNDLDIPAYASADSGYFETMEIRIVLSLLAVIDNSRQDIPLAAVLYSPIGRFTAAELAELRASIPAESLFDVLLQANNQEYELPADLRQRTAAFLRQLSLWRDLARRAGVPELIWHIYRDTGFYEYVGGMPGGLLRQANLRALISRAAAYEKTDFRGLFRFLQFIKKMREIDTDLAVARALSENENVVRVMTIHKSKGLEFPVVILADCGKNFNLKDNMSDVMLHRKIGIGVNVVDSELGIKYSSLDMIAMRYLNSRETKAEELRLLYVAMTRAREKLIITGRVKNFAAKAQQWCQYIDRNEIALPGYVPLQADTYFDWIMPAAARHPDGGIIRESADCLKQRVQPNYADTSHWDIRLCRLQPEKQVAEEKQTEAETVLAKVKKGELLEATAEKEEIEARLNWQYQQKTAANIPAKLSVTELKRRMQQRDEAAVPLLAEQTAYRRPNFVQQKKGLTGTEYGTLMHSVMQHIDYQRDLSYQGIKGQLAEMVDKEIILPEHLSAVYIKRVQNFFASELGRRMVKADRVWRELPFSRLLKAKRFYEDAGEAEIFLQGVIDVLFAEDDGLVLLDYKTDSETEPAKVRQRYELQLTLYSQAVEEIVGQKVKERYLYMLHDGTLIAI